MEGITIMLRDPLIRCCASLTFSLMVWLHSTVSYKTPSFLVSLANSVFPRKVFKRLIGSRGRFGNELD